MSEAKPGSAAEGKKPKRRAIGRKKLRKEEPVLATKETKKATSKTPAKPKKSAAQASSSKVEAEAPLSYPHDLSVRIDVLLYEVVDNFVTSANIGGDYSFTSAADFIRAAIRDHAGGKKLEAKAEGKKKKRMTLRVDDAVKAHYEGLPRGKRTEILERAIRTKLLS